jgi:hypothetical protein
MTKFSSVLHLDLFSLHTQEEGLAGVWGHKSPWASDNSKNPTKSVFGQKDQNN